MIADKKLAVPGGFDEAGNLSNDPKKILDGELDDLIYAYLRSQVKEKRNE